uniref:Tetraspanin-8-like n=1 Tax=Oryzias melastigma TaxID=30732 RepID=A0A3B3CVF3_ORYME
MAPYLSSNVSLLPSDLRLRHTRGRHLPESDQRCKSGISGRDLHQSLFLILNDKKKNILSSSFQLTNSALPGVDLMIAIGTIIMVLGFLGCYGAYRESSCMLLIFFILLLLIFILLLAAGILGALSEKTVNDWVKKRLQDFTPLTKQPESVKQDLEALQAKLKCCGIINGPGDWEKPPPSCYCNGTDTTDCKNGIQNTPCSTKIIDLMQQNMQVVLGISFAIAAILIFGMIFSMMIYCQIRKKGGATRP